MTRNALYIRLLSFSLIGLLSFAGTIGQCAAGVIATKAPSRPVRSAQKLAAPLITGVDTAKFCVILGLDGQPKACRFNREMVEYALIGGTSKHVRGIGIGVYASATLAEIAFNRPRRSYTYRKTPVVGDHFVCVVPTTFVPESNLSPGIFILRRRNVLLVADWQGTFAGAVRFARQVDHVLLSNEASCPKGPCVRSPQVTLQKPWPVVLQQSVSVPYRCAAGNVICSGQETPFLWSSAGQAQFCFLQAGVQTCHFTFATPANVIFELPFTVLVLRSKPPISPRRL